MASDDRAGARRQPRRLASDLLNARQGGYQPTHERSNNHAIRKSNHYRCATVGYPARRFNRSRTDRKDQGAVTMKLLIDGVPYTIWTKHSTGYGWVECILKNAEGIASRAVTVPSWFLNAARKGSAIHTGGEIIAIGD